MNIVMCSSSCVQLKVKFWHVIWPCDASMWLVITIPCVYWLLNKVCGSIVGDSNSTNNLLAIWSDLRIVYFLLTTANHEEGLFKLRCWIYKRSSEESDLRFFFSFFKWSHMSFPIVLTIGSRMVFIFWAHSPISFITLAIRCHSLLQSLPYTSKSHFR